MLLPFRGVWPQVSEALFVAQTASVAGQVTLRKDVSVWFGAAVRGDYAAVEIGERSNVQDNAVIHTDVGHPTAIGCDVTIGHGAVVHGCTLGDRVLVGMHATILNGAVIGDDCIIAAGALVLENVNIPAGSLVVGAPARVLRPLSAQQRAFLPQSARSYCEHAREYAQAQAEAAQGGPV